MPDNVAQIVSITSESLQAEIRRLLPSQQGFGHDLQASNVIIPIVDLTATAEGSGLRSDLQTAWDFTTGHTETSGNNTDTLITNTGFWKVWFTAEVETDQTATVARFNLTDGLSSKIIWDYGASTGTGSTNYPVFNQEFTIFLRAGDSLTQTTGGDAVLSTSYRNIADVNGNLVDPQGYQPQ